MSKVARVRIQPAALARLDDIYRYGVSRWGEAQAGRYIRDLFDLFDRIAAGAVLARPIPSALGVEGFVARQGRHFVYWRTLPGGDVGIVTVLHERMHQIDRLRGDLGLEPPPDTTGS